MGEERVELGSKYHALNSIWTYSRERTKSVDLFPRTDSTHKIHY